MHRKHKGGRETALQEKRLAIVNGDEEKENAEFQSGSVLDMMRI